jgi:hypothetical protein
MNERKPLDLQAVAQDEDVVAELAAELEHGATEKPGKLWTDEFSASGEKSGGGM